MKISCNNLKKHIKDSESIDWIKIWDNFTISCAEVEGIEVKGKNIDKVIVAKIVECTPHPKKDKYHVLKVDTGKEIIDILCGAPNVKEGLMVPLVMVGGMVCGFNIEAKEIAGVLSQGMLCSPRELGISNEHAGILELPDDFEVGKDIKEYLPIEDIIIEIDNKSLTNRPDMWGHYGIAREIAAITKHELLPIPLAHIDEVNKKLDIKIKSEFCNRYTGLTIDNITNKKTPFDIQIFLHYVGMRSIDLLVDLTNYVMLELGQPMHAFDESIVKNIEVDLANDKDVFITLDNEKRILSKDNLMIKNGRENFAIAGVMGGLEGQITPVTKSIFLESANFDATSVRKTATALGLRSEASTRYEKSLDPNLTLIGIKRYAQLLKSVDPDIVYTSSITDVYPKKSKDITIKLPKDLLNTYMGFAIDENIVIEILESLEFKVTAKKEYYQVIVPTFRATKDISIPEDLIEEIARVYGYNNLNIEPLKLDLTFTNLENTIETENSIKRLLSMRYNLNEIHTYLWYKTSFLNKIGLTKEGINLLGKSEDNILRDDLCLSLLDIAGENLKYQNNVGIYEIGTIIANGENKRVLSILLADDEENTSHLYQNLKETAFHIFKIYKNIEVSFVKSDSLDYYQNELTYEIRYNKTSFGTIKVFMSKVAREVAKKKSFAVLEMDFDLFMVTSKNDVEYEQVSKYQTVNLDYTIITEIHSKYDKIEKVLEDFKSPIIISYELVDIYKGADEKRYTIRYKVGSDEKTLTQEELNDFKSQFINHIEIHNLNIVK